MIKAVPTDKPLVINILGQAFKNNKSVKFIVGAGLTSKKRIDALMDYSFELCSLFGEIWLSDDRRGCALILYPHLKRFSFKSIYLDIKLIIRAIGIEGIFKVLNRESQIKRIQPKESAIYLWFIGVDPAVQHRGTGTKLLKEVLVIAENQGFPVYLETSTISNLPWYKSLGFKIYDQLVLDYTLFFLKRVPN